MFVPIAFLGGLTGELYRQFAVTISIAVVISGLVALTLTPALCVLILKHDRPPARGFFAWFNRLFRASVTTHYESGVSWMIRRAIIGMVLFVGMVAHHRLPVAFDPGQPRARRGPGLVLHHGHPARWRDAGAHGQGGSGGGEGNSLNPANAHVIAFTGFDFLGGGFRNNAASIFVTQIPWDDRKVTTAQLVGERIRQDGRYQGSTGARLRPAADLRPRHRGRLRALPAKIAAKSSPKRMNDVAQQFSGALGKDQQMAYAQTLWRANVPQLNVSVDREKAKKLGVPINDLFNALSATLGTYYVNDFNKYGRAWQVLMSAEPCVSHPAGRHRRGVRALRKARCCRSTQSSA